MFKKYCHRTSFFAFPFIISVIMTYFIVTACTITYPRYGTRSCVAAIIISLFWSVCFFLDQRRIGRGVKPERSINSNLILMSIIAFFLGIFLASLAWGSRYLSLAPYEAIDNGVQHLDCMFHSTIAESCKRSIKASTLLNGELYIPYHTFSHLLMGNVAKIMDMPSLIAYNFIFPPLFIPVYIVSQLAAISSVKNYFEESPQIAFIDIVVVILFNVGVVHSGLLGMYGIWKKSYLVSESFLIANTIVLLSYALAFYVLKQHIHNKRIMNIYCLLIIPIEIFVISWSKISVGFVFTAGVMYYLFRTKTRELKYWLLNMLYLGVFIISLWLFNTHGNDMQGTIISGFLIRAFEQYCSGPLGIWGHYLILLIMPALFIILEINKNHYSKTEVINGKTVWIEMILIVSVLAFLPSYILDIGGGSAVYFSYAMEIPALCLLCGHNYVNIDEDSKGSCRMCIYIVCVSWCIWTAYTNRGADPLSLVKGEHGYNISEVLLQIRNEVDGRPEKYTIYIDADSFISQVYTDGRYASYICPSITGVGVINASYMHEGVCYTFKGDMTDEGYGMMITNNDHNLSFDEAMIKAGQMGKEKVIHITGSGYELDDCKGGDKKP